MMIVRVIVTLFERKGTADHELLQLMIDLLQSIGLARFHPFRRSVAHRFLPFVTLERLDIHHPRQNLKDDMGKLTVARAFAAVLLCEGSGPLGSTCRSRLARTPNGNGKGSLACVTKRFFSMGQQPSGPVKEAIRKYITARRLTGHSVTLHWL
jgi:hypothetical protein